MGDGAAGLVQEVAASREVILQACWAHRLWRTRELRTEDGTRLEVVFPGWLNRGKGPDFTHARVMVGGTELYGDVEVHLSDEGWVSHGHHTDPAYDRVVLHVVLQRTRRQPPEAPAGRMIHIFEAGPFLSPAVRDVLGEGETLLRRYEALPGRCGLRAARLDEDALGKVVAHAAEVRARQKAERLRPRWERTDEAQLLYEEVFRALGLRAHADAFTAVARAFPLTELEPFLQLPYAQGRRAILARWFGAVGLLDGPEPEGTDEAAREEYREWRRLWEQLGMPVAARLSGGGARRPWNSAERRLVGMFHHLYNVGRGGWLKGWLGLLHRLDALRHDPELRREARAELGTAFTTPPDEPWRARVSFIRSVKGREARLVGEDRIAVIAANAVIPFFLAYAWQRGDRELEKLLYRLFLVFPGEAPNHRTKFMAQRLMLLRAHQDNLRYQQGLVQIYQDFCTSFYEGCEQCRFPALLDG